MLTQSSTLFNRKLYHMQAYNRANIFQANSDHYSAFKDFFIFNHTWEIIIQLLGEVTKQFRNALFYKDGYGTLISSMNDNYISINDLTTYYDSHYLNNNSLKIGFDEEAIPFADNTFDLIISDLSLHWLNDVPNALSQYKKILKPGGLIIITFIGGQTLYELRHSLAFADLKIYNGLTLRIMPMISYYDANFLLQKAGFLMPVIEVERLKVMYSNLSTLIKDIRILGNYLSNNEKTHKPINKKFFSLAEQEYFKSFGLNAKNHNQTFLPKEIGQSIAKPLLPASYEIFIANASKD